MEFLNTWLQGIIVSVIVATIIEMILPNGNSKKYIKVVLGIYVVFNIIAPVLNKISNQEFSLSSIFSLEEYEKTMETYEISSLNTDMSSTNEKNIRQMYITKLKKDIKAKLEEKGYNVTKINVTITNNEEYTIENLELSIEPKKEENKNNQENSSTINEIETVNITVCNQIENKQTENKENLSEKEKKEVKEYLGSTYEIKEEQIKIDS